MRQIPVLVLTIVSFVAASAAATEADVDATPSTDESEASLAVEYRASDEGMDAQGLVATAFGIPFLNGYVPLFVVTADQSSDATPAEMQALSLLPFVQPIPEAVASAPVAEPVLEEAEAIRDEGVHTATEAKASGEGAEAAADVGVGSTEVSREAAAAIPEQEAVKEHAGSDVAPSAPESEPSSAEPEASDDQAISPAALYATDVLVPIGPGTPEMVAASVAVASLTGTGLMFFPGARTFAVRWLRRVFGLALFSRIAQEDILSHGRRAELFEFIKQNPGERIENARRTLGISNGSMHYHLKVLSERNLIRILRDGGLARLYPAGPKINPQPYVPAQRRRFVELLSSRPGVTQREAATLLGISERMASYHIQTLSTQGLVEVRPDGARKRLFLKMAQPLTSAPVAA